MPHGVEPRGVEPQLIEGIDCSSPVDSRQLTATHGNSRQSVICWKTLWFHLFDSADSRQLTVTHGDSRKTQGNKRAVTNRFEAPYLFRIHCHEGARWLCLLSHTIARFAPPPGTPRAPITTCEAVPVWANVHSREQLEEVWATPR